ncbi:MAG: rRNA adenine N-6-methyltransferase family protein [archaeon]
MVVEKTEETPPLRECVEMDQHFMRDKELLKRIASAVAISGKDVIEVGFGHGELTGELLKKKPARLLAIEKEQSFKLTSAVSDNPLLVVQYGNALQVLKTMHADVLIGNIPYGISEPLLKVCIKHPFPGIVLVTSHAFAEGLVHGSSKTALLARAVYACEIAFTISPDAFYPRPHTRSALLVLHKKNEQMKLDVVLERMACRDAKKILPAVQDAAREFLTKKQVKELLRVLPERLLQKSLSQLTNEEFLLLHAVLEKKLG